MMPMDDCTRINGLLKTIYLREGPAKKIGQPFTRSNIWRRRLNPRKHQIGHGLWVVRQRHKLSFAFHGSMSATPITIKLVLPTCVQYHNSLMRTRSSHEVPHATSNHVF